MHSDVSLHAKPRKLKMIGRFIIGDLLGEGSYSKVKDCLDSATLCRCAVKIMSNQRLRKIPMGQDNVRKEIRIMRRLRHPHVVRLIDVIYNNQKEKIYLFLEHCVGSVQDLLDAAPDHRLPLPQAQRLFRDLASALEYIHGVGVVHRDVKPGNMLLAADGSVRLSDFGVADDLSPFDPRDECVGSAGSPAFLSPEVAGGAATCSGCKIDVWAAGVTLWNMATGTYPFEVTASIFALYTAISQGNYMLPPGLPADLASLLQGMMAVDPAQRLDLAAVRSHPWLTTTLPPAPSVVLFGDEGSHRSGSTVLPVLQDFFGRPTRAEMPRATSLPLLGQAPPAPARGLGAAVRRIVSWFS